MTRRTHDPGPARAVLGALAAAALLLGACGDDDEPGATDTAPTASSPTTGGSTTGPTAGDPGPSTSTSSAVPSTTTTTRPSTTTRPGPSTSTGAPGTTAPTRGCPGQPAATAPAGAASATAVDVDGDGRADTVWAASDPGGDRRVGIVTAAGGGSAVEVDSASPVPLAVLVANADEAGPVEVFVDDNRTTYLFAFVDCRIRPVLNAEGEQYLFDRGVRGNGTGVGCVDADGDGRRDIVGLLAGAPEGDTIPWTRTIVELDGLLARNGATDSGTFTQPGDAAAVELLHTVSCGDLTLAADGVRQAR